MWTLVGEQIFWLLVFLKFCYKIISSYFLRTGSRPMPLYIMNDTFLKFIESSLLALNKPLSALLPGVSFWRSVCSIFAFSHIIASEVLSLWLLFVSPNQQPFSYLCNCLWPVFSEHFHTLSNTTLLMASLCIKIMLIVDFIMPYLVARLDMTNSSIRFCNYFFFKLYCYFTTFLFTLLLSLTFVGPMVTSCI